MRNIMRKEMKLSASPLCYLFILFGFMFFLPGYPILCGAFFTTLGLFQDKREILRLNARVMQDGVALIPLSLYFKDSRVKVELGLCKGKKLYDKRDSDAERQSKRDIDRMMKERNYE